MAAIAADAAAIAADAVAADAVAERLRAACLLAAAALISACGREADLPPRVVIVGIAPLDAAAPATDAAAPSEALAAGRATWIVDPKSETAIDMEAPKERFRGATSAAGGTLDLDLADLASTRGEVKIDLASLRSSSFDDPEKNKAQTEHARTWLEAVVNDVVDDRQRWAVFAIRSIDGTVPDNDTTRLTPTSKGLRSVRLTAHGDLLIHGHVVPKDVDLMAEIEPAAILVRTFRPMRVTLADHDVKPRDVMGKLAPTVFNLLGTKVGDVALVTFAIRLHR